MKKFCNSIYIVAIAIVAWIAIFAIFAPRSEKEPVLPVRPLPVLKTVTPETSLIASVDYVALLLNENTPVADKINTVPRLSDSLTFDETTSLLSFIRHSKNSDGEYVVKNNLMNKLLEQKTLHSGLSQEFISIAGDKNQDIVVRAYALQHLRPLYEITRDSQIREFFYQALTEEDSEVAGGALLALNYLSCHEDYSAEFDRNPIIKAAVKITMDANANNNNRITAIQIAANTSDPDYIVALRNIVSDPAAHATLRISAIAGLGTTGDITDLPVLQNIADSNRFEKRAAQVAINKIKYNRSISL